MLHYLRKPTCLVGFEVSKLKLSTKGRYGIKAMVDLAVEYNNCCLSTSALAAQQSISEDYLERILGSLRKAGLIKATRGAQGGYTLTRAPSKINVGDILRALEGTTDLISCVSSRSVSCNNACSCSARPLWLKLQSRINDVLDTISLQDMADDYLLQMRRN